jgi:acetyl-CoA acetyltransferase
MEVSFADSSRNLSELIFDTVRAAVDDSGREMSEIDSVILAAHDLVDGRSLSSMVTAPAAGAYLRDETRFADDGANAVAAAVARLEAGHADRVIVAAWGRSSEHDPDAFSRSLFDPYMFRPLGLDEFVLSGMRAQVCLGTDRDREARAEATGRRKACAEANPRSLKRGGFRSRPHYPLVDDDMPLWADVTAALILSRDNGAVRIAGLGQASEPYSFGDRKLRSIQSLQQASARALAEAGCGPEDIDLLEIDGLTLIDEALGLEAVGYASEGRGFLELAHDPRCNPSGGGAGGYSPPAMGLARVVEAAMQLRGSAGAVQQRGVRRALATGSSTVAGQTQTAVAMVAE